MSYEQINIDHYAGIKVTAAVKYYLKFKQLEKKEKELAKELEEKNYELYCNPVEILKDALEELANHAPNMEEEQLKEATTACVDGIAKRRKKGKPDAMMKHLVSFYLVPDYDGLSANVISEEDKEDHSVLMRQVKSIRVSLEQVREDLKDLKEKADKAYNSMSASVQRCGPHIGIINFISEWEDRVGYYREPVSIGGVKIDSMRQIDEKLFKEWKEAYEKLKLGDKPKRPHVYQARELSTY